jgi:hypothetical protein
MAWIGTRGLKCAATTLAAVALLAPGALAEEATSDRELEQADEIEELRRQLAVVVDEVGRLRTEMGVPEERALESAHGLGPAASKIYGIGRGLSLGGYAEAVYRNRSSDAPGDGEDVADFTRVVLYLGYKFTDALLFNTEIEFEHASTGEDGSVSVEFATLDYLYRPELNFRAGLLLLPMGFLNEVHEPPFYYGTQRPEPERRIIPTTWRENGAGIFGTLLQERVQYRMYLVNGFDASGFSSSGLRGGRQKGSEARAEDLGLVARLEFDPAPGLRVGGSYYQGSSGQDQRFTQPVSGMTVKLPGVSTRIWEVHGEVQRGPLHLRALYTEAHLGDAGDLSRALELASNRPVAERMFGGYGEIAYDLMQLLSPGSEKELSPFFRFEYLDTQAEIPTGFTRDRRQPRRLYIPGIQYRPHPNVVIKLDYRNIDTWGAGSADEVSVGFGVAY